MAQWPVTWRPHCRRPQYLVFGRRSLGTTFQISGVYSNLASVERGRLDLCQNGEGPEYGVALSGGRGFLEFLRNTLQ